MEKMILVEYADMKEVNKRFKKTETGDKNMLFILVIQLSYCIGILDHLQKK